jgi:hypothetical protein
MNMGHGIRIDDGTLIVKTSPGWSSFQEISEKLFRHERFSFGGAVHSDVDAAFVAKLLNTQQPFADAIPCLAELGWSAVIEYYRAERSKSENRQLEKSSRTELEDKKSSPKPPEVSPEEKIAQLEAEVLKMKPLYLENRHLDYDWWRRKFSEEISQRDGFDPEDVNVRNLHFGARSQMAWVASYPEKLKELETLQSEIRREGS